VPTARGDLPFGHKLRLFMVWPIWSVLIPFRPTARRAPNQERVEVTSDGRQLRRLLLRPCHDRPRDRRAAEQRDEVAASQLIKLHSLPASQGRIVGYRISNDQSGGIRRI